MAHKTSGYAVFALLFLGLAVLIVISPSHVPQWAEERSRLRFISLGFSMSKYIAWFWSRLMGTEELQGMRFLMNLSYSNTFSDFSAGMKYTEAKFDGVPVEIFTPDNAAVPSPAIIYIHGGGWTFFSADSYKSTTFHMASTYNVVVVSIDYRLAPEHPYPVPFEDCVKASVFLLRNARQLGIDPNRVAIAGDSAGGNLAAAVAQRLSQDDLAKELPPLKFQVLIYPALQMVDLNTYSYQAFSNTSWLDQDTMIFMWVSYLGLPDLQGQFAELASNNHTAPLLKKSPYAAYLKHANLPENVREKDFKSVGSEIGNEDLAKKIEAKVLDPYFTPLLAPNLSKVPPAYLIIAQNDVLRDDGLLYAERLRKAGVKTVVDLHKTMPHGFCLISPLSVGTYQGGLTAFHSLAPYVKDHL